MSISNNTNTNSSGLAKFAFNIYGTLNQSQFFDSSSSPTSSISSTKSRFNESNNSKKKLVYNCEKEVTCVSQLNYPLNSIRQHEPEPIHHVVIGGKNYLKLLALSADQSHITQEINMLDHSNSIYSNSRIPSSNKLNNINTIKTQSDTIACGLSNGLISIYKVSNYGKSRLMQKLSDHKRCINSLDFVSSYEQPHQLVSGSQDGTIKLWDLRSPSPKPMVSIMSNVHSDPVRSCQYSPHSSIRNKLTILSVHDSGALCKYDLRSPGNAGQQYFSTPERKWNFHTGPALSLHIHPEKEYVITGGRDQKLCIWNYGDSLHGQNKISPDFMINTYGPVMKVRWSAYPENSNRYGDHLENFQHDYTKFDDKLTYDERESLFASAANNYSLYNYDFACSYLKEDPTITVYNLKRKFIPKEVISTKSHKPFQNFIWAQNPTHSRRIWSLSKTNVFTSYDLDIADDFDITKPLDQLSNVSVAWSNGIGDLCFVNQEKFDFEDAPENEALVDNVNADGDMELSMTVESGAPSGSASIIDDHENRSLDFPVSALDNSPSYSSKFTIPVGINSATPFVGEKPQLHRTSMVSHSRKSPSPVLQNRVSSSLIESHLNSNLLKPTLNRNSSQSTQGSGVSNGSPINTSHQQSVRKVLSVNQSSPYLIPISLPLPINDDYIFETLSTNYLISIPDGFNLIDVCLLNANISASVNRLRDCQIWRMLAVSLEEEGLAKREPDTKFNDQVKVEYDDDSRSILSDLGNVVGSYNSNSTSTTNYGGTGGNVNSVESVDKTSAKASNTSSRKQSFTENINLSTNTLMDTIKQNRGSSFSQSISPSASSNILLINRQYRQTEDNECTIIDDEEDEDDVLIHDKNRSSESLSRKTRRRRTSSDLNKQNSMSSLGENDSGMSSPFGNTPSTVIDISDNKKVGQSPKNETVVSNKVYAYHRQSFHKRPLMYGASFNEDPDDENLNVLSNVATGSISSSLSIYHPNSGSPTYFNQMHHSYNSGGSYNYGTASQGSVSSRRNSSNILTPSCYKSYGKQPSMAQPLAKGEIPAGLDDVVEQVEDQTSIENMYAKSELTKAINESQKNEVLFKPWKTENLLKKTLDYSSLQGDIIMCSTLTLLFYDVFNISKETSLEWLSLYIEILRRKRLFVNAANVIKMAPKDLISELASNNEVNLRLYCCWCQKLLVNEKSKHKSSGFWYCDECSTKQMNCIYCNEQCKGLNVVVSLKCGHRGHFGCLKEWFIEEANVECPGGCDYSII